MTTIMIDPYIGVGHVNATLKLAFMLRDKGYRIVYTGDRNFFSTAINMGFEYCPHNPLFLDPEIMASLHKRSVIDNVFSTLNKSVRRSAETYISDFLEIVNQIQPDLILLDEQYVLKYFLYTTLKKPVVFFQTMPDKSRDSNIPPFTSMFCPVAGSRMSKHRVKWLWVLKKSRNYIRYKLGWHPSENLYPISYRIIRDLGFNPLDIYSYESSIGLRIKSHPLLILSPADLDFPRQSQPNSYRIGPLKYFPKEDEMEENPRFKSLYKNILEWKKCPDCFIVFCSLGTVTIKFRKVVHRFFIKMNKVALLNPDIRFIFSVGLHFEVELLQPAPTNVFLYPSLPQTALLQVCDIMITHGGMNSITECILNEVPMLVYPLSSKWDQPGNSARILYYKLGQRGRIGRDSPKLISKKIHHIRNNYTTYRANLQEMRKKFELKNESTQVIQVIESIITQNEKYRPVIHQKNIY